MSKQNINRDIEIKNKLKDPEGSYEGIMGGKGEWVVKEHL